MRRVTSWTVGLVAGALASAALGVPAAAAQVLRVGSLHGLPGQFGSIQAAVDAARPGDWILIAPGDYKTSSWRAPRSATDSPAAVLVTTPRLRLRGMSRNRVIVDGTRPGSPRCSSAAADQSLGPAERGGSGPLGLNGIMVWKANGVWVQNLTACNFLGGSGDAGNEIWWNGGDGSYKIGGWGFYGSYLNATSTYFGAEGTAAQYGIFSSNWSGGTWERTYASNFNDSGYYIGACQQQCDQTVDHAWAEYNALGYSGSNSGGRLVVKNSEFDNNEDGFDTNSQNGDEPSPQNGACPNGGISPITHTRSCWVFMDNYVHDNNDANVPSVGFAAAGPVGTGMSISGGRNDTVLDNRFVRNGAWGTILVPFVDSSGPPCIGGSNLLGLCFFYQSGDAVIGNTYSGNGFFANATNGDIAEARLDGGPSDCFRGNVAAGGAPAVTSPADLQASETACGGTPALSALNPLFLDQVACDSQLSFGPSPIPCLPGENYPRRTRVVMHPLPPGLPTMPHPCAGVPANPWCSGKVARAGCVGASARFELPVSAGERLAALFVRVEGSRGWSVRRRGRWLAVALGSAWRGRALRVRVTERVLVGRRIESFRFTRVYKRC